MSIPSVSSEAPTSSTSLKRKRRASAFPKSKIKSIMQLDEEIGKMSTAVPLMVSQCVELFLDEFMTTVKKEMAQQEEEIDEAKEKTVGAKGKQKKSLKILTAQQIKRIVLNHARYDFLVDTVETIPDAVPSASSSSSVAAASSTKKRATKAAASSTSSSASSANSSTKQPTKKQRAAKAKKQHRYEDESEEDEKGDDMDDAEQEEDEEEEQVNADDDDNTSAARKKVRTTEPPHLAASSSSSTFDGF